MDGFYDYLVTYSKATEDDERELQRRLQGSIYIEIPPLTCQLLF